MTPKTEAGKWLLDRLPHDMPWFLGGSAAAEALTLPSVERLAEALHPVWEHRTGDMGEPGVSCGECLDDAVRVLTALAAEAIAAERERIKAKVQQARSAIGVPRLDDEDEAYGAGQEIAYDLVLRIVNPEEDR